jgi:prevent-host-death family protein
MEATMHEAKTQLSKLVERAIAGEEVILTRGRRRAPVARLVPIGPVADRKRPIGLYKGQIEIGPEFFEPLPEDELALWEGGESSAADPE